MSRHGVLAVALLALLVAGCSQTIDSDKTETTIARLVTTKIGTPVQRVECPSGRTARKGDTFPCRVTGRDGSAANAIVTATDDDGTVRVTARFLPTDETERSLATQLSGRGGGPVGVDCQDIIVARKDVAFECVTSSGERKSRVRAHQLDDKGRLRYEPVKGT